MSYDRIPRELRSYDQWVYDPITGIISKSDGSYCSQRTVDGYVRISLGEQQLYIYAHRLAFLLMGETMPDEVDHIDLNRSNNKWSNLRVADRGKNACNTNKRKTNKSGYKGVSWAKSNKCWRMDITFKKQKYHSYHATKEEAYNEYCRLSNKLHKEFGNVK